MAGSVRRNWPDRKASLWAYLHGAGTRMVPGQFQYKWHILKVSLGRNDRKDVTVCVEEIFKDSNTAKHEDNEYKKCWSLHTFVFGG